MLKDTFSCRKQCNLNLRGRTKWFIIVISGKLLTVFQFNLIMGAGKKFEKLITQGR